jgi:hypothetical protein
MKWVLGLVLFMAACGAGAESAGVTHKLTCVSATYAKGTVLDQIIGTFTRATTEIFFGDTAGQEDMAVPLNISVVSAECSATVSAFMPDGWTFTPGPVVTLGQLGNWTVTPPMDWFGTQEIIFTVVADGD